MIDSDREDGTGSTPVGLAGLLEELRDHERDYPELIHGPLCGQAADEIDRLRSRLETENQANNNLLNRNMGLAADNHRLQEQLVKAEEQDAQLRYEAGMYQALYETCQKSAQNAHKMISRLVIEFQDYHYPGCPKETSDDARCECFAGALLAEAKDALIDEQGNSK